MHPKHFALIAGLVFLVMGVLAFVPNFSSVSAEALPPLRIENSYGLFLGLFPMNILNKVALIVFGIWGIMAYSAKTTSLPASINFARGVFIGMGALSILGMIPETNTLFGNWPLFGNEVWSHGLFALLGGYFGYALTSRVPNQSTQVPSHEAL